MKYVPEPEDSSLLKCALNIFLKYECYPEALNLAIQLNDMDVIKDIFNASGKGYVSLETQSGGVTGLKIISFSSAL